LAKLVGCSCSRLSEVNRPGEFGSWSSVRGELVFSERGAGIDQGRGESGWKSVKLILCRHATEWYRAVLDPSDPSSQ
jgi:hypothetical protein